MKSDLVLITGINGFIGSHIARLLVGRGVRVRGLFRKNSELSNLSNIKYGLELFEGDIRDKNNVGKFFKGASACFHTAALVRAGKHAKEDYYSNNLQGTINVCETAAEAGIEKFIYTSTCETMRGATLPQMMGDYGRSKFLAEEHVKACIAEGLPAVILNPTAVLGPGDVNTTPPTSLVLNYCRGKIPFHFKTGFNTVDVRDVAEAHIMAFEKGAIGERYLIGGNNVYLSELFSKIKKATGARSFSIRLPYRFVSAASAIIPDRRDLKEKIRMSRKPLFFDTSKAEKELGFRAKFALEKTLEDYWGWKKTYDSNHH